MRKEKDRLLRDFERGTKWEQTNISLPSQTTIILLIHASPFIRIISLLCESVSILVRNNQDLVDIEAKVRIDELIDKLTNSKVRLFAYLKKRV